MDDEKKHKESPVDHTRVHQSGLVRPTMLPLATNTSGSFRHPNIDSISMSPSPLDIWPRLFQPGSLIDSKTYEKVLSSVYAPPNIKRTEEEEDDADDEDDDDDDDYRSNVTDKQLFNEQALARQREQKIQQLSQWVQTNQPPNDSMANIIIQQLNDILEITTTTPSPQHSYPPVNQIGSIEDHDRPYADYGHLNRQTIAEECQFNLQPTSSIEKQSIRLHAKSFAITSWTNIAKESVMSEIKHIFGIEIIQYICVGEEISELNHQRHLHIQIIFKEKIDRRKPFLDEITETHCNYQITHNDVAWNEYIKKGGNYIEFNQFKSTKTRGGQKQWPSQSPASSSHVPSNTHIYSTITTNNYPTTTAPTPTPTTTAMTVRAQAEGKRKHKETIAKQAIDIAKKNVDAALNYIKDHLSWEFIHHFEWYQAAFNYIRLQEQQEIARTRHASKQYTWPESFPDCTPVLREVVNRWINEEFNRTSRAKCLILIGPTGIGKTSFAKSLPGHYNYFKGRWRLDSWNDAARYSIFDDIDWDKYEQLGFPSKKDLLTQNGLTITTDKYKKSKEINVQQPAIVLLNPGRSEGSLTAQLGDNADQEDANYWQHRATIYRMGSNEYFHKPEHYRDNVDN